MQLYTFDVLIWRENMKKTDRATNWGDAVCVDALALSKILGCGRVTAAKVGKEAHARVQIGRRVLYNVRKIRDYVDGISE